MSTKQIIALLNSHIDRDDEQFLSLTLQFAAEEARAGRTAEADRLKKLVQKARDRHRSEPTSSVGPIPMARPRGELQDLVQSTYSKTVIAGMVLADDVRSRIERVLREQRERVRLRNHGMKPSTHLLLVGPPGTGKTMTASALAGELHLPLFTVKLEGLFSRFFGETAAKFRLLFDQVAQVRGVYLLDEFDAIGSHRGAENDVGEMRRVLNSILAFMEEPNATDSILVAATNHPHFLDHALARRFDEVIEYGLPDAAGARAIIEMRLGPVGLPEGVWEFAASQIVGLSHGELTRAADVVARQAVLDGEETVSPDTFLAALADRQSFRGRFRPSA